MMVHYAPYFNRIRRSMVLEAPDIPAPPKNKIMKKNLRPPAIYTGNRVVFFGVVFFLVGVFFDFRSVKFHESLFFIYVSFSPPEEEK